VLDPLLGRYGQYNIMRLGRVPHCNMIINCRTLTSQRYSRTHRADSGPSEQQQAPPSSEPRDFYEILGVPKHASKAQIKLAYYGLAKIYHPDSNSDLNAKQLFNDITTAYSILGDDEKRATYDKFGWSAVASSELDNERLFVEFSQKFGMHENNIKQMKENLKQGDNIEVPVTVSLLDIVKGKETDVTISRKEHCPECIGSGCRFGSSLEKCIGCHGTGEVVKLKGMPEPCPLCSGDGTIVKIPCGHCKGTGLVPKQFTLTCLVPPGVDTGDLIRIKDAGNAGKRGGVHGHLFLAVTVTPDPIFKRNGMNVSFEVPITISQAILGTTITVPTLHGAGTTLTVPPGTQPGEQMVLKGKGLRSVTNSRLYGDQIVVFKVQVPRKLSSHQKGLITEFFKDDKLEEPEFSVWNKTLSKLRGLFDKIPKTNK